MSGDTLDYSKWSKEDLIKKIKKLETHVVQLRNVISKSKNNFDLDNPRKRPRLEEVIIEDQDEGLNVQQGQGSRHNKKGKNVRKFDFSTVTMRHVALKILYLGWDYQGLAVQEDTTETIEEHLFQALTLTKLIEKRSKSNYHRCGRTDKGVSAFCQVISIDLRSKTVNGTETMDYCKILNKILPKEIRVIAWSPVQPDFSARFNCCRRTYKYFFPRGNLDIQKMLQGAQFLVGEHDFRNFCKLDKAKRITMRNIISVEIINNSEDEYDICHLVINGQSFLWHQIRCIVGILLLIGQKLEDPDVVKELLDIVKHPQKPQYTMAIDYPLVLYDVEYPESEGICWTYTKENMTVLLRDLQSSWMEIAIKSEMTRRMMKDIENLTEVRHTSLIDSLIMGSKRKVYSKLLDRPVKFTITKLVLHLISIFLTVSNDESSFSGVIAIVYALTILSTFPAPLHCQDEYIDFTDMGSYDHGLQTNKIIARDEENTKVSLTVIHNQVPLKGISVDNGSRPMKFLQRIVKSILRQMNVQSHTFGPGEAITIDLQAEIKYNDYVILNKFVNAEEQDEPDKYLTKVDDVMSNLIHVVEHSSSSRYDYMDYIFNLPIFCSLKFWLVLITMSVVCFLIVMLSLRAVYATNNVSMLLYGFLIIFILSCIWTFSYMYEDAKATNYAKMVQAQNPPKDCEFEDLDFRGSISYFFRVHLFGYKDQCEQYYSTTMTDPFWSVNPLEAISKSFSVLVFAPFGYIGQKLGLFFGGIISGIPFWLQPLLVVLIFGFAFLSIFGYRVVSPLFTIEPARREYLTQGPSPSGSPAITDRIRNELVERPERKVMKSIRDAQTDMDGFQNYLDGVDDTDPVGPTRSLSSFWILGKILQLWDFIVSMLDTMLRQSPADIEDDSPRGGPNENSFNFDNQRAPTPPIIPRDAEVAAGPFAPRPRQPIGIEDVLIPRRRMHIGLERSESNTDKENLKPCSSSSLNFSNATAAAEKNVSCTSSKNSSNDDDDDD